MKNILFLLIFLLINILLTNATHIVGGHLSCSRLTDSTHMVTLNLYFDVISGDPRALRDSVEVGMFYKKNNAFIGSFVLKINSSTPVQYSFPECDNGVQKTNIVNYSKVVKLKNVKFNNVSYNGTDDFYLAHEQCCRNGTVSNIINPLATGMVFYCEFSALSVSGKSFNNSHPQYKVIGGEYICKGQNFQIDFSATDADGDSLTYNLANPWAGYTNSFVNNAYLNPAPYATVIWRSGFDAYNAIPGKVPLGINPETGVLYVNSSLTGLYVFGVECNEYRNGVKIGTVRHEYQLSVRTCPLKSNPHILVFDKQNNIKHKDTITLKTGVKKCFNIKATDTTANSVISFTSAGDKNFELSWATIPSGNSLTTKSKFDTLSLSACFEGCYKPSAKPYRYYFMVSDNACPVRNTDTVSVLIHVTDTTHAPQIFSDYKASINPVEVGSQSNVNIWAADQDTGDSLTLQYFYPNTLGSTSFENNIYNNQLITIWKPACSDIFRNQSQIAYFAYDRNCIRHYSDTLIHTYHTTAFDTFFVKNIPNIITPNADGANDDFVIDKVNIYPCNVPDIAVSVDIINRYGVNVFKSNQLDFRWHPGDFPDGVYYYIINIQNNIYKSRLWVVR
ncbi:MAG: gliding motility-associated C-terminal domain-containing protein [Cytophagales bacterium]|nr:gliding motility-associated C-terminal domain-containing protein [Cytophagales bacterium]